MVTIKLNNLIFFSYHGVHEEEKILGNSYEVNVDLSFEAAGTIKTLEQTINYVSVYNIIKQRMTIPAALLETLAQDIADRIHASDKRIKSIRVCVDKKNPPIANMEGSVGVIFTKNF